MTRPTSFLLALAACGFAAGCKTTSTNGPGAATRPVAAPPRLAVLAPDAAQALYDRVRPSLVAVQYTWNSELGRSEIVGPGVVVGEDGLVMISMSMVPPQLPNGQMIDFKVVVPGDEGLELEAVFQGRDERSSVAFVKTKEPQKWPALKFEENVPEVGEAVLSVGLLPKSAGYHAYITQANVSAALRGPVPQILVNSGLAGLGSPVFDTQGRAVGLVNQLADQQIVLNDPRSPMGAVNNPPKLYVPTRDFSQSLSDPPVAGEPLKLPWMGVSQLIGVNKELSDYLHLNRQPAVQVGAVIPGFCAERAGLKAGDIIVKLNGQVLERGDEPDEAAMIMTHAIRRMKVGSQVMFTVIRPNEAGTPQHEVAMTLEERPKSSNAAERFYAEDLGFTTREMVFEDRYDRRLPASFKGVLVALVKPSSSAQSGHLQTNDVVTQINRTPVSDLEQFKKLYEEFRKTNKKEAVVLEVLRGVNTEVVRIEPPQ